MARALVTCSPWPSEAATPTDIAQLALLRLLYLQRQAHRTAQLRGFEGTMLLARACVDTCISGLYWLEQPDAGTRLTNASAKSAKQMLKGVMEPLGVPVAGLDEAVRMIGEPADLPGLRQMAEQVAMQSGLALTKVLYEQIYMPLSSLFEHTTGVALQRHIDRADWLLGTPERWWTLRRALHTVDLCTGYLALVLAERGDADTQVFNAYVEAHAKRVVPPAVTMFARLARRAIRLTSLRVVVREVRSLRRAADTYGSLPTDQEREAFARDRVRHAAIQLNLLDNQELLDGLIEVLSRYLLSGDIVATDKGPATQSTSCS